MNCGGPTPRILVADDDAAAGGRGFYREVKAGVCIAFPSRERRTTCADVGLRRRFAPGPPAAGSTSAAGRPLAPADARTRVASASAVPARRSGRP